MCHRPNEVMLLPAAELRLKLLQHLMTRALGEEMHPFDGGPANTPAVMDPRLLIASLRATQILYVVDRMWPAG